MTGKNLALIFVCIIAVTACDKETSGQQGETVTPSSAPATAGETQTPVFATTAPTGPCEFYAGANPSWEEFRADVVRSYVSFGYDQNTAAVTADSTVTRSGVDAREMFDAMPPGAAAEVTQYMCDVAPRDFDPGTEFAGPETLKNIRGMNLRTAINEVDCSGRLDPGSWANTSADPEKAEEELRSIICP